MPYTHKKVGNTRAANKPKMEAQTATPQSEGQLEFWVVEKPSDNFSSATDNPAQLVFKSNPFKFANQVRGGLVPEQVHGFYLDEDAALNAAHDLVDAVYEAARALEEKKETVLEKLDKHIRRLQQEINHHMKEAGEDSEQADRHHQEAEAKMATIKELRSKHKMVGESRKEVSKKEEK